MTIQGVTIEQFLQQLSAEGDIQAVKKIAAEFAADLKHTKETLVRISTMFGLYKNGQFIEKPNIKAIAGAVGDITVKALNPFAQKELAAEFEFLADIANVAKKYQSF